jgi:xanthine dehydrogenase accessory factor
LHAEGFNEAVLREVRAPIGLDIGAVTPEEVALSILAEMIAERRGGTGAPLSSWRRAAK